MLNIAVVDDEKAHRDILCKYIEEWRDRNKAETEVKTFVSSEAFFFEWSENERYDVLFLDVMMTGITGIELAKKLRKNGKKLDIVFTTGISDYMQEGYEVEAMHYLLKPLEKEKVWKCLDKCRNQKTEEIKYILLSTEEGLLKVDASQVLYAEAVGHDCVLTCADKSILVKSGIHDLFEELEENGDFMFCHRSYVINVKKIAAVAKTDILMDNGGSVPVSRRLFAEVNRRFIASFVRHRNNGD